METLLRSIRARHIPKLDALRAVSAVLVMLYHFGLPVPAGFGVMCFFVISGFLITKLLLDEHEQTGRVSLRGFYLRRAFRIFPAFYVYWLLATVWLVFRGRIIWGQAASSFFYVCNYYQGLHHYPSSAYSRTWSLAVEEQFYLVWPWLFCRLAGRRGALLKLLAGLIGSIWLLRIVLVAVSVPEEYLYTAFECRADAIFVGCALAIALRNGAGARLWTALCASPARMLPTVALLAAAVAGERFLGTNFRDAGGNIVEPLLFACLIVQLLGTPCRMLDWLDSRPVRFLGTISYSTYLYHGLVALPAALPAAANILPSYAVATLSYLGVERPLLRLRDRLRWGGAKAAAAATGASGREIGRS